jgi:hypothetical protein
MEDRNIRKEASEEVRIRQRYRSLILLGKARISLAAAEGLVGKDCAYHLYARHMSGPSRERTKSKRARNRP